MDPKPSKSLKTELMKPSAFRRFTVWASLLACLFLFENCTMGTASAPLLYAQASPTNYFRTATTVTIEVYYEAGAEPYTGYTAQGRPYWGILGSNLDSIFQYRSAPVTINIPTVLSEMTNIPAQVKSSWTPQEIIALHQRHHSQTPSASHARFYVYFLRGNYSEDGVNQTGVLGVSLGGTPVIAIFKDVIVQSGITPNGPVAKFVEQSTLVHEMGHALGFVNNGVPMASPHQDHAHGAHSTNRDCVMYWLNEGANDMALFIQRYLNSSSVVMWGPETLADAQNYSQ